MKKISKFLSIIMTLIMVISIIPMSSITSNATEYSGKCGDNLTWTFNDSTGTLTISGTGAMSDYYNQGFGYYDDGVSSFSYFYSNLNRPWESYVNQIKTIIINNGITTIDDYAFANCINLTSVSIPNSVVDMGGAVFYGCSSLNTVGLPNNLKSLGSVHYYEDFRMEGLEILAYCSYPRADGFFEGCKNLTNVTIPNSVTSIGDFAFAGCSSLKKITIPDSVNEIGASVFYGCSSLETVVLSNNISTLNSYIDEYYISYSTQPYREEVYGFFENCTSLAIIDIPNSVKEIGDFAFENCSTLTDIEIPNSVEDMGGAVFYGCSSLETVILSNNITGLNSYGYCCSDMDYWCSYGFFSGCTSLTSIVIPVSVTKIDWDTFFDENTYVWCKNLTDIYYEGTEEQWQKIAGYNDDFLRETIHFECIELFCPVSEDWKVVKNSTCTETGIEGKTCPHGKGETREIPALGHDYGDFTIDKAPTCTTVGSKSQHCSRCNSKINVTSVPATGHTLTWHTLSVATCQTDGVKHGYCDNCSYYEVQTTPITDHGDTNGDGKCDGCDIVLCDHDCHKGGITGFFWKITNFFNRIFGLSEKCSCGVTHY